MRTLLLLGHLLLTTTLYGQDANWLTKEMQGKWTEINDTSKTIVINDSSWTFINTQGLNETYYFYLELFKRDKRDSIIVHNYLTLHNLTKTKVMKYELFEDLIKDDKFYLENTDKNYIIGYKRKNNYR